jgi:hypothetical protein
LMFARYRLEAAKKTSNLKKPTSSPQNWKLESKDNWHAKER